MKKIKTFLAVIFLTCPLAAFAQAWNPGALNADLGLPDGSIMGIVTNILYWLLGLLGVFGIIGFVISGILYLVSTGDEDMIKRAKSSMTYSIIGVIVGLMGYVIIVAVGWALSGSSTF
ncbi:MAG: hypothetical protein WCX17_04475 [Parcubacteria group bacterium]